LQSWLGIKLFNKFVIIHQYWQFLFSPSCDVISRNLRELSARVQWACHGPPRTTSSSVRQEHPPQQQQQHDFQLRLRHWGHKVIVPLGGEGEEPAAQSPRPTHTGKNNIFMKIKKKVKIDQLKYSTLVWEFIWKKLLNSLYSLIWMWIHFFFRSMFRPTVCPFRPNVRPNFDDCCKVKAAAYPPDQRVMLAHKEAGTFKNGKE